MIVKIIYELDIDTESFDPEFVDIPGLVKELACNEMRSMIDEGELEAEDFEYVIDD